VDDIVDRVLACRIAKGVEEAKGKVAARVDGQTDTRDVVVGVWSSLCTAERAGLVRVANVELVVISCEGSQAASFNL